MGSLDINLNDPGVRRLLGDDGPELAVPGQRKRELVQLAGDEATGLASTVRLNAGKREVLVADKDLSFILTVDVYMLPGEPLKVHLICPRCHHHLTVPGEKKAIDFEPASTNPLRTVLLTSGKLPPEIRPLAEQGRLSIEPFECTWELETEQAVSMVSSANLCRWRAAIDHNVVKAA